jgi:hypothetical protein
LARKTERGGTIQVHKDKTTTKAVSVDERFPNIARWVDEFGWIEIGQDDYSQSFLRVLDAGGMVWEGKAEYASLDHALRALDKALGKRIEENG